MIRVAAASGGSLPAFRRKKLDAGTRKQAELVKLRYFAGLTNEQAAPILNISEPTAKRWWAYARAWLQAEISTRTSK